MILECDRFDLLEKQLSFFNLKEAESRVVNLHLDDVLNRFDVCFKQNKNKYYSKRERCILILFILGNVRFFCIFYLILYSRKTLKIVYLLIKYII